MGPTRMEAWITEEAFLLRLRDWRRYQRLSSGVLESCLQQLARMGEYDNTKRTAGLLQSLASGSGHYEKALGLKTALKLQSAISSNALPTDDAELDEFIDFLGLGNRAELYERLATLIAGHRELFDLPPIEFVPVEEELDIDLEPQTSRGVNRCQHQPSLLRRGSHPLARPVRNQVMPLARPASGNSARQRRHVAGSRSSRCCLVIVGFCDLGSVRHDPGTEHHPGDSDQWCVPIADHVTSDGHRRFRRHNNTAPTLPAGTVLMTIKPTGGGKPVDVTTPVEMGVTLDVIEGTPVTSQTVGHGSPISAAGTSNDGKGAGLFLS